MPARIVKTSPIHKSRKIAKFRPKNVTFDEGDHFHVMTMLRAGHSVAQCSRVMKCDPKTIRNVRKRVHFRGPQTRVFRQNSADFQAELDSRRKIVAQLALEKEDEVPKFPTSKSIADACPFDVSPRTVLRYLSHEGIVSRVRPRRPKSRPGDEEKRVKFSVHQLSEIFENPNRGYIFSDEKIFDSNQRGERRQFVMKGSHPRPRFKQHWAPKVMVWGAIGINFRKLVIFDVGEKITSKVYVEKVLPHVIARIDENRHEVFIHDGAKPHTALCTKKYLCEHQIQAPEWPPRSPDLNVIENLWAVVEKKLPENRGEDSKELAKSVLKAWNSISQATINSLVQDFENRLARCVELRGGFVK